MYHTVRLTPIGNPVPGYQEFLVAPSDVSFMLFVVWYGICLSCVLGLSRGGVGCAIYCIVEDGAGILSSLGKAKNYC